MKKFISVFAVLLVSGLFAATGTFQQSTNPGSVPKQVPAGGFSFLVADYRFAATPETVYTQVFDLFQMPLVYGQDTIGRTIIDTANIGHITLSCYDINDSAAVVDSVLASATTYQMIAAGDGTSPGTPFSTAWDSVGILSITKASDANLVVAASARPALKTREYRYMRWRLINNGVNAKNIPECRLYYSRRPIIR